MSYRIYSIEGNRQRLDGGAMFGNVPRALWAKWIAPDERNRIPLACRAFLIHDTERERRVLLEAGIGCFFEPKLADRFGVAEQDHRLLAGLAERGVTPEQVDEVVLSHLHFDHVGGLLTAWSEGKEPQLVFPRARFVVGRRAWERATDPHPRDRASFIPPLLELLQDSDRLAFVDDGDFDSPNQHGLAALLGEDFSCTFSDGHTPGMLLTRLQTQRGAVVFCGDLIPGFPWLHLPITMGYDRYPERLIDEKKALLEPCLQDSTRLLFTHDPSNVSCRVGRDDKGRYCPIEPRATLDGLQL